MGRRPRGRSEKPERSDNFISYKKRVKGELKEGLIQNLHTSIRVWQRELLLQLSGRRTGRMYFVPGTKTLYQASAPGESPAVVTGVLRASYGVEVLEDKLQARVGSELDYALYLERGTPTMEPRPAIEPAFQKAKAKIADTLGAEIKDDG